MRLDVRRELIEEMAARCERDSGRGELWDDVRAVVVDAAKSEKTESKVDIKAYPCCCRVLGY